MSLLALGLNHHTAPVAIRERASFAPEIISRSLRALLTVRGVQEAAIVSTCNRTEIYLGGEGYSQEDIHTWLHDILNAEHKELSPYLFSHFDRQAVQHLLRVCSGLDSLILGEPQILGQVKQAYQAAEQDGTLGSELNRLFQHAFAVAKQVRTDTEIGSNAVSVAFAAVQLARKVFGDLNTKTAFMLGASETNELAAKHLLTSGVGNIVIVNRTFSKAQELAQKLEAQALPLEQLPEQLHHADIVVGATASPVPILGKGVTEQALKKRKRRHMLMIDIAVPRDIEEQVGHLDEVFLYTVDDLNGIIEEGRRSREHAARQAELIIDQETDSYMRWLQSLGAQQTIRLVREQAEENREKLVQKALTQLQNGKQPESVLQSLSIQLTNKFLHQPSQTLRQAGEEDDQPTLAAARLLFGINQE